MKLGRSKAIIGTLASGIGAFVVVPVVYWFIIRALDSAVGWRYDLAGMPALIASAASFLIGLYWVLWAWSYLVFVGQGLPMEAFGVALHPTRVLVTNGPYAYTRNPMILGVLFIMAGVALLQGSKFGLILLPADVALISLYLVVFEENGLKRRFGADYEAYRHNVPQLLPRLSAYVHVPVEQG